VDAARSPGRGSKHRSEEERISLLDAFAKLAVEREYAKISVREVALVAGLPQRVFNEHFRDKRQCLTSAYDRFFERLHDEIADAMDRADPWALQVKAAVVAGLAFVREGADLARFFAVEALSQGAPVIERHTAAVDRIAAQLRRGRDHSAGADKLSPLTEHILIAGLMSLVTSALLAEDLERLDELEADLVSVLLAPYVGAGEAQRVAA
jgi:AcrR family transcriptional regulator